MVLSLLHSVRAIFSSLSDSWGIARSEWPRETETERRRERERERNPQARARVSVNANERRVFLGGARSPSTSHPRPHPAPLPLLALSAQHVARLFQHSPRSSDAKPGCCRGGRRAAGGGLAFPLPRRRSRCFADNRVARSAARLLHLRLPRTPRSLVTTADARNGRVSPCLLHPSAIASENRPSPVCYRTVRHRRPPCEHARRWEH